MLFSCKKNDVEVVNILTSLDTQPTQSIMNLETIYTDSGKIKLKVTAPLVERFSGDDYNKIFFSKGIRVLFFDKNGLVESSLSAKHAIYHENETLWEASDSVVAINNKGEVLNTELLFWNEKENRIYSNKFVKITTEEDVIYGNGFESDQTFSSWTITKVKGVIYHDPEK